MQGPLYGRVSADGLAAAGVLASILARVARFSMWVQRLLIPAEANDASPWMKAQ